MSATGQPRHRTWSRTIVVATALMMLGVAAACGTDSDPFAGSTTSTDSSPSTARAGSSTTSTSATTTSTGSGIATSEPSAAIDATHQAIIDAYVGYWNARAAANSGTPNPQDPALAAFATGNQLDAVVAETQKNLDEDRGFRASSSPANFRKVTVVSVDGDQAEVQECFVDDDVVIERSTGNVIDDSVSTQSVIGTLRFVDGTWKVSGSQLVQDWEGVAGCALAS